VVTTVGDMDDTNSLPKDVTQCHQLLLAAYQQARQLEQQVTASQHEVVELGRVLDATADSFEKLQQEHAASLEELAWYKRWVYGKRRERMPEGEGQQHLFELTPADNEAPELAEPEPPCQEVAGHTRRRRRELDLSRLPHHRHELDLSPEEKTCSCCGRAKDRIGEDVTKILEHVPAKLEVHEHIRPKYACNSC
jgi:hypothetical protein